MMHSSGLDQLRRSLQLDVEGLNKNLGSLDSRLDKQRFFEANNSSFMIPKKFEYNPVRRDETETLVHKSVLDELEVRKRKLQERLATLKGRFLKFSKVEKILKGSLDLISSPSPSVKIQIMGGKVCLRFKGKILLSVVNKLFVFKSLLKRPNNVLPLHLKQTFPPII